MAATRACLVTLAVASLFACAGTPKGEGGAGRGRGRQEAVGSIRNEPRSFNRHAGTDAATDLVSNLTQAKLVRINKVTQDVEPWLAERITVDEPGRRYTVTLRPDLTFSDGHALTADDVAFSFEILYSGNAHSRLGSTVRVAGQPIEVVARDPRTVAVTFPSAFAAGLRLLDAVPILPRHKLGDALKNGTFDSAWSLSTPPADIVGAGPFLLKEYASGQRLVLEKNPRYWRKDAQGAPLPYLDRLTLEIVPDGNAELLRLQAGQLDMTASEVPPESYASVKRAADAGTVKLFDLGPALDADSFWFNLKPGAFKNDRRAAWLQRDELRRAISMAVDRTLFADTVYFGAGEPIDGPETPSNKKWFAPELPRVPHDPAAAHALLASIGAANARFTVLTQKGRPRLERGAAVIRDELKKIGVTVDVVPMDPNALIDRILKGEYESVYFNPQRSDTDPAVNQDFWLSSGGNHFWNMNQPKPATDWERRLDELTVRQIASPDDGERKRIYTEMLTVFAAHQPVVYFAAPKMNVAVSSRVTATLAIAGWPVLWQPDSVSVTPR